jgi:hypothetical protein
MNTSPQSPESASHKHFPHLYEVEALATDILKRLESGEPLSSVVPGARRLAELTHDDVSAKWVLLESIGTNGLTKVGPGEARTPQEIRALEMFFDLHSMMDMKAFDELSWQKLKRGEFPPDTTVAVRGIPDLERTTPPLKIPSTPDAVGVDYKQRMKSQVIHGEIQTILNRVRQTVHRYVAKVARQTMDTLRIVDRLGPDAPAVFQVAGRSGGTTPTTCASPAGPTRSLKRSVARRASGRGSANPAGAEAMTNRDRFIWRPGDLVRVDTGTCVDELASMARKGGGGPMKIDGTEVLDHVKTVDNIDEYRQTYRTAEQHALKTLALGHPWAMRAFAAYLNAAAKRVK